jgi:hypothetical protein
VEFVEDKRAELDGAQGCTAWGGAGLLLYLLVGAHHDHRNGGGRIVLRTGCCSGRSIGGKGIMASLIGKGALLFAAIGVVVQLKDALNTVWEVEEPKESGVWHFVRTYILSLAAVIAVGFLLLVSPHAMAARTAQRNQWQAIEDFGNWRTTCRRRKQRAHISAGFETAGRAEATVIGPMDSLPIGAPGRAGDQDVRDVDARSLRGLLPEAPCRTSD